MTSMAMLCSSYLSRLFFHKVNGARLGRPRTKGMDIHYATMASRKEQLAGIGVGPPSVFDLAPQPAHVIAGTRPSPK